mgnify:CR=1 FL=1
MSAQHEPPRNQILVEALVKKYRARPVLDHLSLAIEPGEFCILVGDNGVGKTTLLRILAGLVRPDGGKIRIGAHHGYNTPTARRQIGYVGHQPMVYQDLNAIENLTHYARLYNLADIETTVAEGIHFAGLERYQHQTLRTYSRGMQQRLSIARALLHDPDILLFDEPYTGLDKDSAHFLDRRLHDLHQGGKTIFLAAHHPQRLMSITSHVAWLKDGVIAQHNPIHELQDHPDLAAYLEETA